MAGTEAATNLNGRPEIEDKAEAWLAKQFVKAELVDQDLVRYIRYEFDQALARTEKIRRLHLALDDIKHAYLMIEQAYANLITDVAEGRKVEFASNLAVVDNPTINTARKLYDKWIRL